MEPVYVRPPRTILEVFENLPEGTLAQLINNQIIMSPAPTTSHQRILGKIYNQLSKFIEENSLGETFLAPCDVYLNRRNAFQPDILFVAKENLHMIKERGVFGAPDLIVEILSPETWRYDKEDKKDEYERSGVKEYWMVDPLSKETEGFILFNNEYKPLQTEKGKISFHLLNLTIQL